MSYKINEKLDIKVSLKATVSSLDYAVLYTEDNKILRDGDNQIVKDFSKVQIVSNVKINGKLERYTFTLHKELTVQDMDKMVGKTFEFLNVKEYRKIESNGKYSNYSFTYSATEFKEIQSKEPIFEISKNLECYLTNVCDTKSFDYMTKKEKIDTCFQLAYIIDRTEVIKDIYLKDTKSLLFTNLINKKVLFVGLVETLKNGKNYITISTPPKLVIETPTPQEK